MKERPILFHAIMVQATLNGTKTQTRRVIKGQALDWLAPDKFTPEFVADPDNSMCPYGKPGDGLWVRETWSPILDHNNVFHHYAYKADCDPLHKVVEWKPSIFMPKEACRIKLLINDVKVERLHDISEDDAKAEGIERWDNPLFNEERYRDYSGKPQWKQMNERRDPVAYFKSLWQSINGIESWESNPWVWKISFEKI